MAFIRRSDKSFVCSGVLALPVDCQLDDGYTLGLVFGVEYLYSSGRERNRQDFGEPEEIEVFGAELLSAIDETGQAVPLPERVAEDLADRLMAKINAEHGFKSFVDGAICEEAHTELERRKSADDRKPLDLFEGLSAAFVRGESAQGVAA